MWGVELRDGLCGVQKAREEGECLLGWQPLDLISAVSSCLHYVMLVAVCPKPLEDNF